MYSINYLPEEILESIFEKLQLQSGALGGLTTRQTRENRTRLSTLAALCQVSKTFNRLATPLLYRVLDLNNNEAQQRRIVPLLVRQPHLAKHVQVIILPPWIVQGYSHDEEAGTGSIDFETAADKMEISTTLREWLSIPLRQYDEDAENALLLLLCTSLEALEMVLMDGMETCLMKHLVDEALLYGHRHKTWPIALSRLRSVILHEKSIEHCGENYDLINGPKFWALPCIRSFTTQSGFGPWWHHDDIPYPRLPQQEVDARMGSVRHDGRVQQTVSADPNQRWPVTSIPFSNSLQTHASGITHIELDDCTGEVQFLERMFDCTQCCYLRSLIVRLGNRTDLPAMHFTRLRSLLEVWSPNLQHLEIDLQGVEMLNCLSSFDNFSGLSNLQRLIIPFEAFLKPEFNVLPRDLIDVLPASLQCLTITTRNKDLQETMMAELLKLSNALSPLSKLRRISYLSSMQGEAVLEQSRHPGWIVQHEQDSWCKTYYEVVEPEDMAVVNRRLVKPVVVEREWMVLRRQ